MQFVINQALVSNSRSTLSRFVNLYWIVGGAGSGKTTICRAISEKFDIPIYDMDAHIYGYYHGRFSPQRHPVNTAWASAENGLAWLLDMSWDEFNIFNQAALPEYLDLLAEDLKGKDSQEGLIIDGGIANPALIARVMPAKQILCLSTPKRPSSEIWQENEERRAMKEMICQLPNGIEKWQKFLTFDSQITAAIIKECAENNIPIIARSAVEKVEITAQRAANILGIGRQT